MVLLLRGFVTMFYYDILIAVLAHYCLKNVNLISHLCYSLFHRILLCNNSGQLLLFPVICPINSSKFH